MKNTRGSADAKIFSPDLFHAKPIVYCYTDMVRFGGYHLSSPYPITESFQTLEIYNIARS